MRDEFRRPVDALVAAVLHNVIVVPVRLEEERLRVVQSFGSSIPIDSKVLETGQVGRHGQLTAISLNFMVHF